MVDVLNLEWSSSPGRDRNVATLICNYLRYQGLSVVEGSVFDGFRLIRKHKPKLFFMNGVVGARINLDLVKYANSRGVKTLSLNAEGNITENKDIGIAPFFWGCNTENFHYEDLTLLWSRRVKDLVVKELPYLEHKLKVSGGVGFDLYKILKEESRLNFFKKYQLQDYQHVIGVGCWDFGVMYNDDYRHEIIQTRFTEEERKRFIEDGIEFNRILKTIVSRNPDVLFILKEHPGSQLGHKASGIEGLNNFDNTLIIKREESVDKCISVSDVWIVYESTTSLEAWLMNKPTFKLNPSGEDFKRNNLHMGSPLLRTEVETKGIIDIIKNGDPILQSEMFDIRKNLIKGIIQFDDGLNHVRAGNEIISMVESANGKVNTRGHNFKIFAEVKHQVALFISSKNIRKFSDIEAANFSEELLKAQKSYYQKRGLSKEELRKMKVLN